MVVAIYCIVYNHEPYLRDCLNGFVMQKTNFRFVAIVHDELRDFVLRNRLTGINRIVPFGETTTFSLAWDELN